MTQQQRLLDAFQEKQDLMVYEIMAPRPQGLGIAQYNARIKELREQGHPIVNVEKGHFRYQLPEKKEKPMAQSFSYGYQKFQEAGKKLKTNQLVKRFYEDLTDQELQQKKETAETWLNDHKTNINYAEALKRYEQICDELAFREAKEALL